MFPYSSAKQYGLGEFPGRADAFEQLLSRSPDKAEIAARAFVERIGRLSVDNQISFACFLDVEDQPAGAFHLVLPKLRAAHELAVCVWSRKSNAIVDGYHPEPAEAGVIVYDVCSSGKTLREVAFQLHRQYGAYPRAALVYLNDSRLNELKIPEGVNDKSIVVQVIDIASDDSETRGHQVTSNIWRSPKILPDSLTPEEGLESTKEEHMHEKGPSAAPPPNPKQQGAREPIKHLALKQAIIRFAAWAGWLPTVDKKTIQAVLSYRPVSKSL
jgi:hypothetical protein